MCTNEENGVENEAIGLEGVVSSHLEAVGSVIRESCNLNLSSRLWFGTFAMLIATLGVFLIMKALENEWYIVIKPTC